MSQQERMTAKAYLEQIAGKPQSSREKPTPQWPEKVSRQGLDLIQAKLRQEGASRCRLIVWHGRVVAKPRMTRADQWKKRPPVMRYWEFADSVRQVAGGLGDCQRLAMGVWVSFPKSYPLRKQLELRGKPHRLKPDADNFLKSIDAIFEQDCAIWDMRVCKYWDDGNGPRLELYVCCCEKGDCRQWQDNLNHGNTGKRS